MFLISDASLTDRVKKEQVDSTWNLSHREMMQKLGTDCMREHFGNQHWVKHIKLKLHEHKGVCVVISGIRFLNEAAFVRTYKDSIIIRITCLTCSAESHTD